MALIQLICPFCNATITADTSNTEIVCSYCGKSITFGQSKVDDTNGRPLEVAPVPDRELISNYNSELNKWKRNCTIFTVVKAILSFVVWAGFFIDSESTTLPFTVLLFLFFVSSLMFLMLPLFFASKYPDGSNIPNANIKKPSKFKIKLEFYLLYFFISVVCFFVGALFLLRE
ncbi:MAG: TFIIB-type zinc ribbon-containing protein [Ruminococcus sp.]|nr:TFIIB-type zinc ribbon-containing protein [Ruminococcus sp.]